MNDSKFNKWFNAFLLVGMIACVTVACVMNLGKPDARVALTILSSVGALMGVISVVLSANGNILTFVFGLVDVLIYSYTLLDQNVPMTLGLHLLYFLPMEFIGFFGWRKRGATAKKAVQARRLTPKGWLNVIALFILVYGAVLAVAWLIARYQGTLDWAKMSFDTAVTTANIVALVLMAKAYMDQWYLWLLVNITSIILWIIVLSSGEGSEYTVVQLIKYSFYLLNGLNAIRIWLKLSAPGKEAESGS
ncbi:MAG: nicotinamide mononucleotide transporter [Bacteroidales bacterium]|nr:nicotinamide mononucleotide transporter [Bacteroidales bacterium]